MAKGRSSIANLLTAKSIKDNTTKEKQRLDIKLEAERNSEQVEKVPTSLLQIDPVYQRTIRPQRKEEAEQFRKLINDEGIRDALVVYDNNLGTFIVDGHHRLQAAKDLGIDRVPIKRLEFESQSDAVQWMLRNQLGRRNLLDAERIEIALALEGQIQEQAKANLVAGGKGESNLPKIDTREEVAKLSNTSARNVGKYKKIKELGDDELVNEVLAGEKSIHKAYTQVVEPKKKTVTQTPPTVSNDQKKVISSDINTINVALELPNSIQTAIANDASQYGQSIEETIVKILSSYYNQ
ncbi:ParB/RepB/Spo0J family partition protein [Flammeovirga agarivorans]|uniref:ParB N-terminal domain-containing protein n=1 Tax=Flammeovirga agarivorans TaxID=2726742 RepID=A0A7X8SNL1_9BACT|nr:ParB/RepB/Spo0J family partition protein [Flammeovirga agarivorans]NLR93524.1 ParB N-terminal domain-containing protein [Flammeovirga agarivorans]